MSRRAAFALLAALALPAAAQQGLPKLEPLPEPPPPPPGMRDADLEPSVTIIRRGEDKVEEYRLNGKLYMIKVTPPHGVPYYLVDEQGHGVLSRKESVDSATRPPMWVIGTF